MLTTERTVNIGIETAANALKQFLKSGDSPADCSAILSTINSELQSISQPHTVQCIVQSFLESDLLSSACDVWNHEKIPESLELEILGLFYLVTQSIFEGSGDLTSGLQYRDSLTNRLVCKFYHKLYKDALGISNPRLAKETNMAISDKLVSSLPKHPNFVMAFFDHNSEFVPYTFFVQHIPRFYELVARCMTSCKEERYLQSHVKEHLAELVRKVMWDQTPSLWDKENAWKLLFFCEVLQGNPISDQVLLVFDLFLHSIDSWKVLFEVCLYFLNMVPHNSLIDSIIAESVNTRMILVMKNTPTEPLEEQEELVIWDFICKVLECSSFDLILGLFYDVSLSHDQENIVAVITEFRTSTFELMAADAWFIETFSKCFPDFCRMVVSTQHSNVEWSRRKSLSSFILSGVTQFFLNSLITNRFLYSVTIHLLAFDCTEVTTLPIHLLESMAQLLSSVDAGKFEEFKCSVLGSDSPVQIISPQVERSSIDEIYSQESPFTEVERAALKQEGMKQNFYLLEAIVATVYAAIKAKHIADSLAVHSREPNWRLSGDRGEGDDSNMAAGNRSQYHRIVELPLPL